MQQAVILDLFTDEQLNAVLVANKDNADVVALINGRREAKARELAQAKEMDSFKQYLADLQVLPPPPQGVLNVYASVVKATRPLTKAERKDIKATLPAITEAELDARIVELDGYVWSDWTINKAMTTTKSSASGSTTTKSRKLAITITKRDGMTLTPIGNFRTSKEACDYLQLTIGKDSARRVLEAHSYLVDDYDGADFKVTTTS
jgi:hypothetical protein